MEQPRLWSAQRRSGQCAGETLGIDYWMGWVLRSLRIAPLLLAKSPAGSSLCSLDERRKPRALGYSATTRGNDRHAAAEKGAHLTLDRLSRPVACVGARGPYVRRNARQLKAVKRRSLKSKQLQTDPTHHKQTRRDCRERGQCDDSLGGRHHRTSFVDPAKLCRTTSRRSRFVSGLA